LKTPEFLYKYHHVDSNLKNEDLLKDSSIENLFNKNAIFSSRLNFNDLFDSKVEIIWPEANEYVAFIEQNPEKFPNKKINDSFIYEGKYTGEQEIIFSNVEDIIIGQLDKIFCYCLSRKNNSNLMWSHYANSHKGFCIQFKYNDICLDFKTKFGQINLASRVKYQDSICKLNMIDQMKDMHEFALQVFNAFSIKLDEWSYEDEYRIIANPKLITEINSLNGQRAKLPYNSHSIDSVIFGCRMPERIKQFIMENLPYKETVKFKEAKALTSSIDIINL
jgi:hypothetical protein